MSAAAAAYAKVALNDEDNNEGNDDDDDIELTGLSATGNQVDGDHEDRFRDEEPADEDEEEDFRDDDDDDHPSRSKSRKGGGGPATRLPSIELLEEHLLWNVWNRWEEPCVLSLIVTGLVLLPTILLWMYGAMAFVGVRFWCAWIFVLHLQLRIALSVWYVRSLSTVSFRYRKRLRLVCSAMTILELLLCGIVYPTVGAILIQAFFTDHATGSVAIEWTKEVRYIRVLDGLCWTLALLRCVIGLPAIYVRTMKHCNSSYREWRPTFWVPFRSDSEEDLSFDDSTRQRIYNGFRLLNWVVMGFNLVCFLSALSHFGPWPMYSLPENCDPLDETECALPFPSFHHMIPDESSKTGFRVHLRGLPPLRGGIPFHPRFVNELDGFSTMAPILFYLEGMKEAKEKGDNRHDLQGPENIELSVTQQSVTFLIDVDEQKLVHHSAEVDYLDPKRPLILVFPAAPLKHSTHYALAVVGATDEHGRKLPRTKGMTKMLKQTKSETRLRTIQKVIPAMQKAAPWYSFAQDPESLQLLFDFVTISEESQLGPIRRARDGALEHVRKGDWKWKEHVDVVSIEDHKCNNMNLIARTVHLDLDVPWFLDHHSRYAVLDDRKLQRGAPVKLGKARALIQIPCSLKRAAEGATESGKELRAILEYGHGLFYFREEVTDKFLQKMAEENGYINMAMDWRGMSIFDLPVVIKTLIGKPDQFQSVRDNLIQGFADKLCLQHFSQNGMLDLDVFHFDGKPIPWLGQTQPVSAYYGISQGGILGAGYMSYMGSTGLVDRGVLGVPGTPFALVMSRSLDFSGYDLLLLLNFYNNRHVRILLSLVQMAWDSAEASGHQAPPVKEPIPRLLLQAGLGDPVVPTIAAEALARALNASTLPNNPRSIYGIAASEPASPTNTTWLGPQVTLNELLYEKEYNSLPLDDTFAQMNPVHICVRLDDAFIAQIVEFINTGRVIDPCEVDQCRRMAASC